VPATQKTDKTRREVEKSTHQLADGKHLERPQGRIITMPRPEVDGAPRPGGRVRPREGFPQQPRLGSAMGSASSLISKMRSHLSIKGTNRRWCRLARTHPAVSPPSASSISAATSESSRAWFEGGDTPWYQEAALSRSTLPV
jgi:hypothetical protein